MSDPSIRAVVVEESSIIREGLCNILAGSTVEVVAAVASAAEAVERIAALTPHVVYLGAAMAREQEFALLRSIREAAPQSAVILVSFAGDEDLLEALRQGACGYLSGNVTAKGLLLAAQAGMHGYVLAAGPPLRRAFAGAAGPQREQADPLLARLTPREREVLRLLCRGLSNPEIAGQLTVTAATIRSHVSSILHKLGLPDRVRAAVWAAAHGLGPGAEPEGPRRR